LAFAESIFKKKYFENNKILEKKYFENTNIKYTDKSILKIQNKIQFCIFKIKYYFENSILHITDRTPGPFSLYGCHRIRPILAELTIPDPNPNSKCG